MDVKQCDSCWYSSIIHISKKVLCHLFRPYFLVPIDGHCKKWKSK